MSHIWPLRVYYKDTDAGGVVYHGRYLEFFSLARTEWLRSHGIAIGTMHNSGLLFPVRRLEIAYHRPLVLDDEALIRTAIYETKKASLIFKQEIIKADDASVYCDALVQLALIEKASMKPVRLPAQIIEICKNNKESKGG